MGGLQLNEQGVATLRPFTPDNSESYETQSSQNSTQFASHLVSISHHTNLTIHTTGFSDLPYLPFEMKSFYGGLKCTRREVW